MELINVESSNINAIGYDESLGILEIEFNNGYAYEYYDVPSYEYDQLMAAESKGKYANKNIYRNYRNNRIR